MKFDNITQYEPLTYLFEVSFGRPWIERWAQEVRKYEDLCCILYLFVLLEKKVISDLNKILNTYK